MANLANQIRADLALAAALEPLVPGTVVRVLVPVAAAEVSPEEKARMTIVRTVRVGTFRCDFMADGESNTKAVWTPRVPDRLTKATWKQYAACRDAFLKEVAVAAGMLADGAVAILE